jgi:hypothetical protein
MKYITSFLFAILFCLVILTQVANCAPEADAYANDVGLEGGGFERGLGRGKVFRGLGREGDGKTFGGRGSEGVGFRQQWD